jgi:hypothetical protein
MVRGAISRVIYFKNNFGIVQIMLDHNDPAMKEIIEEQYTLTITVTSNFDRKPFKDELYEFTGKFKDQVIYFPELANKKLQEYLIL